MKRYDPQWTVSAVEQVNELENELGELFRLWAAALARRDHAEFVLVRHVEEADRALRSFPRSERWSPRWESTIGGVVSGIAAALPDLLGALLPEKNKAAVPIATGACLVVGLLLIGHAWFRTRLR